jgi:Domain of Unknown Function (DUF1206)
MAYAHSLGYGHGDTLEKLARLGYATKGLLYLLVGGLATAWAFGEGGRLTDQRSAVASLRHEPFGHALTWAVAVGLGAYALWRLIEAIFDPESGRSDAKQMARRVGYAVSGVAHAALCVAVAQLALGHAGGGEGRSKTYLAKLLHMPGGAAIVIIAGLVVVGIGLYELHAAITERFMLRFRVGEMSPREQDWARRVGQLGLVAHGVVFFVIGYFLIRAASSGHSARARGLGGALREIAARSHGVFLLGVVAIGLLCYAAYLFLTARYLRRPAE